MYRDDPLDDEAELRELIGDEPVNRLAAAESSDAVAAAVAALRVLQGWADEDTVAAWFTRSQARLDGRTPVEALTDADDDVVLDAARAWAAANG